ncbi:MAG: hypothetical protein CBE26_02245 [Kiritimatiellaceae bacterium TMED266]|nr:MAG: hypothetical protein CBE26_02245 [Kiritimatiellaceae bacterium TMED266]
MVRSSEHFQSSTKATRKGGFLLICLMTFSLFGCSLTKPVQKQIHPVEMKLPEWCVLAKGASKLFVDQFHIEDVYLLPPIELNSRGVPVLSDNKSNDTEHEKKWSAELITTVHSHNEALLSKRYQLLSDSMINSGKQYEETIICTPYFSGNLSQKPDRYTCLVKFQLNRYNVHSNVFGEALQSIEVMATFNSAVDLKTSYISLYTYCINWLGFKGRDNFKGSWTELEMLGIN